MPLSPAIHDSIVPSDRRTLLPAICASPTTLSASVTSLITSSSLKARIAKSSDPASSSSLPTFAKGVQSQTLLNARVVNTDVV